MNNLAFLCTDGGVACDTFWVIGPMQLFVSMFLPILIGYSVFRFRNRLFRSPFRAILTLAIAVFAISMWSAFGMPLAPPVEITVYFVLPVLALLGVGLYYRRNSAFVARHFTADELAVASSVGVVSLVATLANALLIVS